MEEQSNTFTVLALDTYIRNGYQINYAINKQNILYIALSNKKLQILCVVDIVIQSFEQLELPVRSDESIISLEYCLELQIIVISFQSGKVVFCHKQNDKYHNTQIQFEEQISLIIYDPNESSNILLGSTNGKVFIAEPSTNKKKFVVDVQMSKPICNLNKPTFDIDYYSFQVDQSIQQTLSQIRQEKKQNLIQLNRIPQYQQQPREILCYVLLVNFQEEVIIIQALGMYLIDILSQLQYLIDRKQHYSYVKQGLVNRSSFNKCNFIRNNNIILGFSLIYTEKQIKHQYHINQSQESNDDWEEIDQIQINKTQAMSIFGSKCEYETHVSHIIKCNFPMDIIQLHKQQFNEDVRYLDIKQQCKILMQHNEVFNNVLNAMCSKITELMTPEFNYQINKPICVQQVASILCILFQKHMVTINTQNTEMAKTHHIENSFHPVTLCQFSNSILMFGQKEIKQIFIEDHSHLFTLLQNEDYDQLIIYAKNASLPSQIIYNLYRKIYQHNNKKAVQFLINSGISFFQQCVYLITNSSNQDNILYLLQMIIQYNYNTLSQNKYKGTSIDYSLQIINMQFSSVLISFYNTQVDQINDQMQRHQQILNFNTIISMLCSIKSTAKSDIISTVLKQLLNTLPSLHIIFPWIKALLNYIDQQEKINILTHLSKNSKEKELFIELLKYQIQDLQDPASLLEIPRILQPDQYLDQFISKGTINSQNSASLVKKIAIYSGIDIAFDVINKLLAHKNTDFILKYYQVLILQAKNMLDSIDLTQLVEQFVQIKTKHQNNKQQDQFVYLQTLLFKFNHKNENIINLYQQSGLIIPAFIYSSLTQNYDKAITLYNQHELFKDKLMQIQLLIFLMRSDLYNIEQILSIVYKDNNIFNFQLINAIDKSLQLNIQWQKHVDFLKQQYYATNNHINRTSLKVKQCQITTKNNYCQVQLQHPLRCSYCKVQIKRKMVTYRCAHILCPKCSGSLTTSSNCCPLCNADNVLNLI